MQPPTIVYIYTYIHAHTRAHIWTHFLFSLFLSPPFFENERSRLHVPLLLLPDMRRYSQRCRECLHEELAGPLSLFARKQAEEKWILSPVQGDRRRLTGTLNCPSFVGIVG